MKLLTKIRRVLNRAHGILRNKGLYNEEYRNIPRVCAPRDFPQFQSKMFSFSMMLS